MAYLKATLFALVLVLGGAYVSAWSAPASDPPGGSVSLPINTGDRDQNKTGSLGVWNLATAGYVKVNGYSTPGFDKGDSCSSGSEGSIRYNSDTKAMQFCDGSAWSDMSGGSTGAGAECGRSLPDGKTYSYPHGTYYLSAGTFYVPNCVTTITVTVQGDGGSGYTTIDGGNPGGGGGSGGYTKVTSVSVTPGSSHTIERSHGNAGKSCFDTTCATNGKSSTGMAGGAGGTPGGNPGRAGTFGGTSEYGGKGGDSLSGGTGGLGAVYNWPYSMTPATAGVSGSGGGGGATGYMAFTWTPSGCDIIGVMGPPCTGYSSVYGTEGGGAGGAGFVQISY